MKQLFILANWKANKTIDEARVWVEKFSQRYTASPNVSLIICPAFHHIPLFAQTPLAPLLGIQDLSAFSHGAYTGEIAASMVSGIVKAALLGHSERRKNFGETDAIVAQKTKQAIQAGIIPIVCVSDVSEAQALAEAVPEFVSVGRVLYEPLSAIGTGNADSPDNANAAIATIAAVLPGVPILYGGSVTAENVKGFVQQEHIAGVGVGGASLDPEKFLALVAAVA
jgi:triosephosphate isomerase